MSSATFDLEILSLYYSNFSGSSNLGWAFAEARDTTD